MGRHTRAPRGHAAATVRLTAVAPLAVVAVALVLTGCSPAVAPERTAPVVTAEPEEVAPTLIPGGSAEENLPYFAETLRQFSAGTQPVEGRPLVDALVAAGFDRAAMQVSFDRSKTDLVADSILVSVLVGSECLIGQVVTADRAPFSTVEPALTASGTVCLIGNTRPIDW